MTKRVKSGVRPATDVPDATERGTIFRTKEWAETVAQLDRGITSPGIQVTLPASLSKQMRSPNNAFLAALRRRYIGKYRMFARSGVIYITPRRIR